jgi:hypothetical protein
MDISFGNAWDWVRDRALGGGQAGGDLNVGDGILGPLGDATNAALPSSDTAVANSGGILPDVGGVNLGQSRFDELQSPSQPYAWSGDNGGTVYIERPDHSLEIRQGGTLTWRDNNPGNLRYAPNQEIGHNDSQSGRFAIFDSPKVGSDAQTDQLFAPKYGNLTIAERMAGNGTLKGYAPSSENDTEAYISDIERRTGLDRSTVLNSLSNTQRAAFVGAIQAREGLKPGFSSTAYYNLFGD